MKFVAEKTLLSPRNGLDQVQYHLGFGYVWIWLIVEFHAPGILRQDVGTCQGINSRGVSWFCSKIKGGELGYLKGVENRQGSYRT